MECILDSRGLLLIWNVGIPKKYSSRKRIDKQEPVGKVKADR